MKRAFANWYSRHQNRWSFALHMVGIPACFVAAPVLLILQQWWWALGCFVGGYALQFLGHAIEGNRSGEELLVRRLLGKDASQPGERQGGAASDSHQSE